MSADFECANSKDLTSDGFDAFVVSVEPVLRAALVARHGRERGAVATAEALSWAWERWERVREIESPIPYLVKVGTSRTRMRLLFPKIEPLIAPREHEFEPGLDKALRKLSDRQRSCVVLIAGCGLSFAEAGEVLSVTKPTVQKHFERGIERLRNELGVAVPESDESVAIEIGVDEDA